jgi:hypothetical protein
MTVDDGFVSASARARVGWLLQGAQMMATLTEHDHAEWLRARSGTARALR